MLREHVLTALHELTGTGRWTRKAELIEHIHDRFDCYAAPTAIMREVHALIREGRVETRRATSLFRAEKFRLLKEHKA